MKKAILALLLIAGIAFTAGAQQAPQQAKAPTKTPQQRAMRMTKNLTKGLNLTAKQAKQVDRIYLTQAIEMDSIRNYPSNNRRADMKQRKYVKQTADQNIMNILSTNQQQQFVQYKKMVKQKNIDKRNRNAHPSSAPGDDNDNQG
jgi:hypothetical protein